jgi:16S rRNA (cytosine967-C5)-methyltransferase
LIERWLAAFGREQTHSLVDLNNQRPEIYLHPIGLTADDTIERLRAADLLAERVDYADHAVRIAATDVVRALALVPAIVQDPAAALVVRFAAFGPGLIADLCAAPGGKAIVAAAGSDGTQPAFVIAGDVSPGRLRRVAENVARLALTNLALVAADARQPPLRRAPQVLIDAPCTGTGTFRRHPDGRWRITPAELGKLVELQRAILAAAAAIVEPGGLLVYATCSLESEENEQQVENFLALHQEFTLESSHGVDERFRDRDYLRVLPQRHGFDGVFAARLRRTA